MPEREKQIMDTFEKVVPQLSEADQAFLLGFGEGMAAMLSKNKAVPAAEQNTAD